MSGEAAAERVRAFVDATWAPWKLQVVGADLTGDDLQALLDERDALRAQVERVRALAEELRYPDVSLFTPIERATRRTVSRELRAALDPQ